MAYNAPKSPDWRYKGKNWKLSRSKIDLFLECPRCFYLDNVLGIPRPSSFPMNLNTAVDMLLKKEFDYYRKLKKAHPIMTEYNIKAIPFEHEKLDIWRENFKGIQYFDKDLGFIISGAVDDLWINEGGELIVVDYKSTSKNEKIDNIDKDWQKTYKRQVEVYQWLLRQLGFKVSSDAYFVYANASQDEDFFDNKLVFELTAIKYTGDDSWVYPTIKQIKQVLDDPRVPLPSKTCEYCAYRKVAGQTLQNLR